MVFFSVLNDLKLFRHRDIIKLQLADEEEVVKCFQELGIIPDKKICVCSGEMRLQKRSNKPDVWRCRTTSCRKEVSFLKDTFFSGTHLKLIEVFEIVYWWSREIVQYKNIRWEMGRDESNLGDATICDWLQFCRDVCVDHYVAHPKVIGGPGVVVEIDETVISKRKYNKGRIITEQVWIFGGIERENPSNCFMEIVPLRNADTLLPIIQSRIAPGSIIISDLWRAYFRIDQLPQGYTHLTVNHSENFINPENGAYTQGIESSWQKFKAAHKTRYGTHRSSLADYIVEHCWRKEFAINNLGFFHFWQQVIQQYS